MKMEDLQGSVEARELRLNQREADKESKQALIAHSRKGGSDYMKRKWKQGKGKHQREVTPHSKEKKKFEEISESSKGGRGSSKFQNKKSSKIRERFNASIVRSMVTLLQFLVWKGKEKYWCRGS